MLISFQLRSIINRNNSRRKKINTNECVIFLLFSSFHPHILFCYETIDNGNGDSEIKFPENLFSIKQKKHIKIKKHILHFEIPYCPTTFLVQNIHRLYYFQVCCTFSALATSNHKSTTAIEL